MLCVNDCGKEGDSQLGGKLCRECFEAAVKLFKPKIKAFGTVINPGEKAATGAVLGIQPPKIKAYGTVTNPGEKE